MESSKLGHKEAMEKAAMIYLVGDNLEQNITMARELFERLADQGSPRGQLVSDDGDDAGAGGGHFVNVIC